MVLLAPNDFAIANYFVIANLGRISKVDIKML